MTVHPDPADPAHLSAEQRLTELAALLAGGVLRLQRRAGLPVSPNVQIPAHSRPSDLDLGVDLSPHGPAS